MHRCTIEEFSPFQVMLDDDQIPEDGQKIAETIMEMLQIDKADLVDCAYVDLLNKSTDV